MPNAGDRIGPYEILESVGAGGMGQVYKARDTRLGRLVAIKFSKEQFSERFEREATAIASLNHPHICQLYDVGPDHLVMEFVEGEPLQCPLPLDEALRIAGQIAEALEAAHDKGIVHRDLKPGNILVKPDGSVKVLDFGLAKLASVEASTPLPDNSPTLSMAATQAGVVLGTAAYMSPEQARGKSASTRADIWAFGVVLYEMLTGKRLFAGEDLTETLASVVKERPDLIATPVQVRRLLEACLQKDPKNRLQAIGDWKLLLDQPQPIATVRAKMRWLWPAIAGLLALATGALAIVHFRELAPPMSLLNLSVTVPDGAGANFVKLSPDGHRFVVREVKDRKGALYLRSLDSPEFRGLEGTENARSPFWSPDGRFIGFFADGKLKTIPASGGPSTTLCSDTGLGKGGTWNSQGVIMFSVESSVLRSVSASGGECAAVNLGSDSFRARVPEFLPDGNHFLFAGGDTADLASVGLYVASLDGMKPRRILKDNSSAQYAPPHSGKGSGHLLFLRQDTLMAQIFDAAKLDVEGDPFPVVQQVSMSPSTPQMDVSVAPNGTLMYVSNRLTPRQLTWFDRSGNQVGKVDEPGNRVGVWFSPDGNIAASNEQTPGDPFGHIRLFDLLRNSSRRLTSNEIPSGVAVWSPDGSRLVYSSLSDGTPNLFLRDLNGGEQSMPLIPSSPNNRAASDWSRDGRFLIYTEIDPKTRADIWYLTDPGKPGAMPVKFLGTTAVESQGMLSPDGHWLAYSISEADVLEVVIRSFPTGDRVIRVPGDFASEPRWNEDGSELYYLTPGKLQQTALMSVSVQAAPDAGLQLGKPQQVAEFEGRGIVPQSNVFQYSPHPDGRRFLVQINSENASPTLNVITNWQQLAARR